MQAEIASFVAKIAECQRLLDASTDPLSRDVYRAMLGEFTARLAAERSVTTQGGLHDRHHRVSFQAH